MRECGLSAKSGGDPVGEHAAAAKEADVSDPMDARDPMDRRCTATIEALGPAVHGPTPGTGAPANMVSRSAFCTIQVEFSKALAFAV